MYSDDCFNGELKWNYKFFQKIRKYLNNAEQKSRNFFFSLNKYPSGKAESDDPFGIESENQKLVLQLHILMESREFIAFRLILIKYITEKPEMFIFSKLLEYEEEENKTITKIKEKNDQAINEKIKYETEISILEEVFESEKKNYIYKFSLLNEEKSKKIEELSKKQK
jgi:hypothetical protein